MRSPIIVTTLKHRIMARAIVVKNSYEKHMDQKIIISVVRRLTTNKGMFAIWRAIQLTDQFFVSCRDAGKTALILGPFTTETECRKYTYSDPKEGGSPECITVKDTVCKIDGRAHFASWGMLKIKDVKPEEKSRGLLNRVDPGTWDKVLS